MKFDKTDTDIQAPQPQSQPEFYRGASFAGNCQVIEHQNTHIESGDLAIRAGWGQRVEFKITVPGKWVLEFYIPERVQGFDNNQRILTKATGKTVLRRLQVDYSFRCGQTSSTLHEGQLIIKQTKKKEMIEFETTHRNVPVRIALDFSTYAVIFPLHFCYDLKPIQKSKTDQFSIDWLQERFARLPIDDKVKISRVLAAAYAKGWQPLGGSTALTFDNSNAVNEMKRKSIWKIKAFEQGLIRPFLLLVSMHPRRRIAWAISIDIKLYKNKRFGDSHWESYYILTCDRLGIVPRTSRTFRESMNPLSRDLDWYQICFRVLWKINSTKREGMIMKMIDKEKMDETVRAELKAGKVDKGVSMEFSKHCPKQARAIENMFLRQFIGVGNRRIVNNLINKLKGEDGAEGLDELSKAKIMEMVVAAVESDPFLSSKYHLMVKHGFDGHKEDLSTVILCALKKEVVTVEIDSKDKLLHWNKNWGSQTRLVDRDFRAKVEAKLRKEKRCQVATTALTTTVPIVLASLAVSPAVVSTIMVTRSIIKFTFPELPASVCAVLSGILMQRMWLAMADIGIEDYYP